MFKKLKMMQMMPIVECFFPVIVLIVSVALFLSICFSLPLWLSVIVIPCYLELTRFIVRLICSEENMKKEVETNHKIDFNTDGTEDDELKSDNNDLLLNKLFKKTGDK